MSTKGERRMKYLSSLSRERESDTGAEMRTSVRAYQSGERVDNIRRETIKRERES